MKRKWWRHFVSFAVALLFAIALATPSQAHWADLSVAEIALSDTQTQMTLTFPTGLVATADDNKDGRLSVTEVQKHRAELQSFLSDRIRVTDDNQQTATLVVKASNLAPNFQDRGTTHSTLILTYTWLKAVHGLNIDYRLFLPNVPTARCVATILQNGKVRQIIFTPQDTKFSQAADFSLLSGSIWQQIGNFIGLGIEHILTGYDHVLFLVSLLLLGGGINYLLKVVTAFTVAHSITLSLAVLNSVSVSPRLVESAIALTIVYVAAENFWRKDVKRRWLITFIFGLVHGLGFAGILKEINIPAAQLPLSLASFNIGVEIGQILIVSTAYVLMQTLVRPGWRSRFRYILSAAVIIMGMFWFWERTFFNV